MKNILILSTIILSLTATVANGQAYKYRNQEVVGSDGKTYSERSLEKSADAARTPNTPGPGSGTQYRWEKARNDAASKEYYAEQSQKKEAAKEFFRKEKEAAKEKMEADRTAALALSAKETQDQYTRDTKWKNYFYKYMNLSEEEQKFLLSKTVDKNGKKLATTEEARQYADYYVAYKELESTGTYEEAATALDKLRLLPSQVTVGYLNLAKRFPEKRNDAERRLIDNWVVGGFPGMLESSQNYLRKMIDAQPAEVKKAIAANPDVAWGFVLAIYRSREADKKPGKDTKYFQKQFLELASPEAIKRYKHSFGMMDDYLNGLTNDELMALGKKCGVSPAFLAMPIDYMPRKIYQIHDELHYDYFLRVADPKFGVSLWRIIDPSEPTHYSEPKKPEMFPAEERVKYFATKGDVESMLIYGIMMLRGFYGEEKREEGLTWMERAFAANAPYTQLNIYNLGSYEKKLFKFKIPKKYNHAKGDLEPQRPPYSFLSEAECIAEYKTLR